jgi:hypothetical protein
MAAATATSTAPPPIMAAAESIYSCLQQAFIYHSARQRHAT